MATETKITVKELILKRAEISKKIADFEEKISNEEWSPLLRKFYKESIPCENGVVYEVTSKHGKSKKYNRFIVYTIQPEFFMSGDKSLPKFMIVTVWGWWLDDNDVPSKWAGHSVFGVSNPITFKKSANQKNKKVPHGR